MMLSNDQVFFLGFARVSRSYTVSYNASVEGQGKARQGKTGHVDLKWALHHDYTSTNVISLQHQSVKEISVIV
jgi:hypothetical protein